MLCALFLRVPSQVIRVLSPLHPSCCGSTSLNPSSVLCHILGGIVGNLFWDVPVRAVPEKGPSEGLWESHGCSPTTGQLRAGPAGCCLPAGFAVMDTGHEDNP